MKRLLLPVGILLLFAVEIMRVYFIMPFPGSQQSATIGFAYWLGRNIVWIRIALLVLIALPFIQSFQKGRLWKKILLGLTLLAFLLVFYLFNFRFEADAMFYQPKHKTFSTPLKAGADSILVIGVAINGEAKAFPVQLIGYHHQVRDTIGDTPAIITYCTVCRTGRVFSPLVKGKPETFRLVGMDHFNAMFEDAGTKSWWQQATGIAIAGPLKGMALAEIPSQQLSLAAWLRLHPASTVLEPDSLYKKQYADLTGYNKGTIKGSLEKRDSASWQLKSWVVGVAYQHTAKAYDWNDLVRTQVIEDTIGAQPIILALENDSVSFHVWSRQINDQVLHFEKNKDQNTLTDTNTRSSWTMNGFCTAGILKDTQLKTLPAYQEFWHSWKQFHANTGTYHK